MNEFTKRYNLNGMEPKPVFTMRVAELIAGLEDRIEQLEAKLAEKPKAAAKKTASE